MLVDIGPVCMTIRAEKSREACEPSREEIEGFIRKILSDLREHLPILRQKAFKIKKFNRMPPTVRRMIEAVKLVDEENLTPMASVAGAISDEVRDFLKEDGFDFISINNGGDISIFSGDSEREVRISIGDINKRTHTGFMLLLRGLSEFGVATSGIGGRSLTLGLAEIGTVVARSGAIADAAATAICNHTNVESKNVIRKKGKDVDPTTDIPDDLITVSISGITEDEIKEALRNGLDYAKSLKKSDIILDAVIILKKSIATTVTEGKKIRLEVLYGNKKDSNDNRGHLFRWGEEGGKTFEKGCYLGCDQEPLRRHL
jgi:ApbE superfamily uncharacterized protein (UPF0280 family)